jgi:sorbitol-specific phosphotransferase system component IIC
MHTHYRTLLLGIALALMYVYALRRRPARKAQVRLLAAGLVLVVALLFTNRHSSAGRWFIVKQAGQVFLQHWQNGAGSYSTAFNHQQAVYFSNQPSLHTNKALLASDGFYCNNEFLQLGIEKGIVPVLLLLLLTAYFIHRLYTSFKTKQVAAPHIVIALLIPFITGLFLSYPLHQPVSLFVFCLLFCLLIATDRRWGRFAKAGRWLAGLVTGFTLLLIINRQMQLLHYKNAFNEAVLTASSGYTQKAIALLLPLQNNECAAQNYAALLAGLYHQTGQTANAIALIESMHQRICTHELHQLLGNYYIELRDTTSARQHYFTCLYIKPCLLQSRLNVAQFYKVTGQPDSALFWVHDLLRYPVKINSSKTEVLRQTALQLIAAQL